MFSSRHANHPSPADAARGEDLAFYLQLDLEHEPKDVVEVGVAEPLPLADASVDIIYGLHGFHCMESFDVVHAEMMRLLRPGGRLVWACSIARDLDDGARVVAGAMRAAGFVDVKIDVTRLQGAARWTPVVGTKPR